MRWILAAGAFLSVTSPGFAQDKGASLHDAIGAPDALRLSGSFRTRGEVIDGQFRPDKASSDQLLSVRTTLFAEYDTGPVRFGAEFRDARGYGQARNSSADSGVVNTLEFSQYYLGLDLADALGAQSDTTIEIGRMTMALGSARLIARQGFRNSMNAYTGVRFERRTNDKQQFTAFWTMPNIRLPRDNEAILDNESQWDRETTDVQLFGAFLSEPLGKDITLELYGYGLVERDAPGFETTNRHLFTPGLRVSRKAAAGRVDFDVELIGQVGHARKSRAASDQIARDVAAWSVHASVGHRWTEALQPRVSAFFDYASGNRANDRVGRFDFLYGGRRFEFGPSALFGPVSRSNLISAGARAEIVPAKGVSLSLAHRALWLASATDSFGLTGVRDPSGRSGRFAGKQLDLQLVHWIVPQRTQLDLGYAHLFKGNFLRTAPNAPATGDSSYGYAAVTFTF